MDIIKSFIENEIYEKGKRLKTLQPIGRFPMGFLFLGIKEIWCQIKKFYENVTFLSLNLFVIRS